MHRYTNICVYAHTLILTCHDASEASTHGRARAREEMRKKKDEPPPPPLMQGRPYNVPNEFVWHRLI